MSKFAEIKTEFRNEAALIAAMMETTPKWTREMIEVHKEPQNLHGYTGDTRAESAHIIVRRQNVQEAGNDLGFERTPEGTYRAHISNFDRGHDGQGTYGEAWLKRLRQNYAYHAVRLQQEAAGRTVSREFMPNGRQRLMVRGYR
jgi:hypothetical protein